MAIMEDFDAARRKWTERMIILAHKARGRFSNLSYVVSENRAPAIHELDPSIHQSPPTVLGW